MKSEPSAEAMRAAEGYFSLTTHEQMCVGIEELAQIIDEEFKELVEAAESMNRLYGNLWDTEGGGGFISPESIPKYDAAFEKLHKALAKVKGETP